jgi:hypothetical protein
MTPFIVSSQVKEPVIKKLKIEGFRIEHRHQLHMGRALLQQYGTTALIAFIDALQTNDEFTGKPVILLLDDCPIRTRLGVSD